MKNLRKITALFIFCALAVALHAQKTANDKLSVVKFNALGVLGGQYQLAYERAVAPKLSLQLSAGYLAGSSEGSSLSTNAKYENKRTGYILIPEVRFYPGGNAAKGFFIAGFGRFRNANNTLTDNGTGDTGIAQNLSRKKVTTTIGGGATIGYQWIRKGGFSFDIYAGLGYKTRKTTTTYDKASLNEAATDANYDSIGDELFSQKYINFSLGDTKTWTPRFGLHLGYAF